MTTERRAIWVAAAVAAFIAALWAVSAVLLPFVVGFALAYLFDPWADALERRGMPRWAAATLITAGSVLIVVLAVLLLVPLLQAQIMDFAANVPRYIELLRGQAMRLLDLARAHLSAEDIAQLRAKIGSVASPDALAWVGRTLRGLWGGGVAFFNLLSLLFITPLVTFYLLRDWDRIVGIVDGWLPRAHAPVIRTQVAAIDGVLSGFVRGQFTVCLALGVFYAVGLGLVRLDFGLVIGLATGIISFVPIFGMLIGFVVGVGVALVQFGFGWQVVAVAAVFLVGQVIEGNFLTPKLVGSKVGLHPVWTIFALLAGGALAGFTGLLLAVPAAAVIGVLSRFAVARWTASQAYRGDGDGADG